MRGLLAFLLTALVGCSALATDRRHYHHHHINDVPDVPPTDKCYFGQDELSWYATGANDVVVVRQPNGQLRATQLNVKLPRNRAWGPRQIFVNGVPIRMDSNMDVSPHGNVFFHRDPYTCQFTNNELQRMRLMPGKNDAILKVMKPWREIWLRDITVSFNIHFFNQSSRFVAFDIDSPKTIKEHGYLLPEYGIDEEKAEAIELLDKIERNGYSPVYLTSRPFIESEDIRYYLFERLQHVKGHSLPEGPLFMAPRAYEDAIANVYKTMSLLNLIKLFDRFEENIFVGAYGHIDTDVDVYIDAGISTNTTYLEDRDGKLFNVETKEESSYQLQTEKIDSIYPKLNDGKHAEIANLFSKLMLKLAKTCPNSK